CAPVPDRDTVETAECPLDEWQHGDEDERAAEEQERLDAENLSGIPGVRLAGRASEDPGKRNGTGRRDEGRLAGAGNGAQTEACQSLLRLHAHVGLTTAVGAWALACAAASGRMP